MGFICDLSALIFKLQHHYISNVNTLNLVDIQGLHAVSSLLLYS